MRLTPVEGARQKDCQRYRKHRQGEGPPFRRRPESELLIFMPVFMPGITVVKSMFLDSGFRRSDGA
jgi:hypothetical protein